MKSFNKRKVFLLFGLFISGAIFMFYVDSYAAENSLANRLRGYVLLQVEQHGEAWYVGPEDAKRIYMPNGASAYDVMGHTGLGISNADLDKIPVGFEDRFECTDNDGDGLCNKLEVGLGTDINNPDTDGDGYTDRLEIESLYNPLGSGKLVYDYQLANRLKGYIVLQVERNGQAWYINPRDGKRYYMADGDAAYQIMRFLSLGITDNDLNQIAVSDYKTDLPAEYCGDNICNNSEDCNTCNSDCACDYVPVCGNGVIESGEQCDNAAGVTSGYTCNSDCVLEKLAVCGNGIVETGEQCDGTVGVSDGYQCNNYCRLEKITANPICGNGIVETGEQCDGTAGISEGYKCNSSCILEATLYCGDGVCDYPGEDQNNCSADCSFKGPEDLFNMNEMFDASTLNTQIKNVYTVSTSLGELRAADVKYYVGNWRGVDIYNTGTVYFPKEISVENKGKAAIMQGYSKDVQTGPDFLQDFAQNTALIFGIPVYSCSCGYPAEQWGYESESAMSQDFKLKMLEDNDLTRNVVIPLSMDYMRAMTMLGSFSEIGNPSKFVTTGSSKRGFTQWVLAAVDSRVKGFMSNAFSAPDQVNLWNLVKQEFGDNNLYGNADDALAWLATWPGQQYQYYYDPIKFPDKLKKPLMVNIGTNDREPITSLNSLFLSLSQPKAFEAVANYPHGWGSVQHLGNWRSIIDRTFFGRKTPVLNVDNSGNNIEVTVTSGEIIKGAKLVYGINYNQLSEDQLGKEGTWYELDMENQGDKYVISKSVMPSGQDVAYYVEVEDERNGISSYTSSIIYIK